LHLRLSQGFLPASMRLLLESKGKKIFRAENNLAASGCAGRHLHSVTTKKTFAAVT
jgi:hypothetical protein